jgi:hypothetical protein
MRTAERRDPANFSALDFERDDTLRIACRHNHVAAQKQLRVQAVRNLSLPKKSARIAVKYIKKTVLGPEKAAAIAVDRDGTRGGEAPSFFAGESTA